ncbi:hypothetical protein [Nocardiopsis synnemataformans]|uniref:hypothetical protein n=1 Tax=Nocardiopsis synnemataformans TaxID=61305 RepID=UPI003EBB7375
MSTAEQDIATAAPTPGIEIDWRVYGRGRSYRVTWPTGGRAETRTPEEARLIAYALTKVYGWPITDTTEEDSGG